MATASLETPDLSKVLQYLEIALQILDASDAPAQIGAHLDLALCQLREHTIGADSFY